MPEAPIEVVEYAPHWVELFAFERELLARELKKWLVGVPEHIGSTAVPGLAAKPIVDIMAPVASLEASLKQSLAQAHRADREAYTSAKGPFIERVLQAARKGSAA